MKNSWIINAIFAVIAAVMAVMQEIKPSQKEKFVFSGERIRQYLPKTLPFERMEDYVCKALEYYGRHLRAKENSR